MRRGPTRANRIIKIKTSVDEDADELESSYTAGGVETGRAAVSGLVAPQSLNVKSPNDKVIPLPKRDEDMFTEKRAHWCS